MAWRWIDVKSLKVWARVGVALCFAVQALLSNSAGAQPADRPGTGILVRPGVVADAERGLVVLMRPASGIEAVELASGKMLWESAAGDMPLAFDTSGRLVAQVDNAGPELLLTALDSMTGEVRARIALDMPKEVVAGVDDTLDRRFLVRAQADGEALLVAWRERFQPIAAMPQLQRAAVFREGAFRVYLDSGKAETLDEREAARLLTDPPPDLTEQERLSIGAAGELQFRSVDGGYAMTSVAIGEPEDFEKYAWTIWDRESADPVGGFTDFQRANAFGVFGAEVVLQAVSPYVRLLDGKLTGEPLRLRARKLDGGEEIWSRAIRDTAYTGPVPH